MKDHGTVKSCVQPKEVEIDDFSVWVASDIKSIKEDDSEESQGFSGYEYKLIQYDKDEYIKLIGEKNESLEAQITDTQVALCEVYELMV